MRHPIIFISDDFFASHKFKIANRMKKIPNPEPADKVNNKFTVHGLFVNCPCSSHTAVTPIGRTTTVLTTMVKSCSLPVVTHGLFLLLLMQVSLPLYVHAFCSDVLMGHIGSTWTMPSSCHVSTTRWISSHGMQRQCQTRHSQTRLLAHTNNNHNNNVNATSHGRHTYGWIMAGWMGTTSAILLSSTLFPHANIGHWIAHKASLPVWSLVHALCGMLFSGAIVISALLEGWMVARRLPALWSIWYQHVPAWLQACVIGPALTGSVVSGVAQSILTYGSLRAAPKYIQGGLHALNTMALWWLVTDLTIQSRAIRHVKSLHPSESWTTSSSSISIPNVLKLRQGSNVVSCLLLVAIYALMVLKPGYHPPLV
jgi:hypothetical protein